MVNSWLYCSCERNCSPGRASSVAHQQRHHAADHEEGERRDQVHDADLLVVRRAEQPQQVRTLHRLARRIGARSDRLGGYGRHSCLQHSKPCGGHRPAAGGREGPVRRLRGIVALATDSRAHRLARSRPGRRIHALPPFGAASTVTARHGLPSTSRGAPRTLERAGETGSVVARVPGTTRLLRPARPAWLDRDVAVSRFLTERGVLVVSPTTDPPAGPAFRGRSAGDALALHAARSGPPVRTGRSRGSLAEVHSALREFRANCPGAARVDELLERLLVAQRRHDGRRTPRLRAEAARIAAALPAGRPAAARRRAPRQPHRDRGRALLAGLRGHLARSAGVGPRRSSPGRAARSFLAAYPAV